MTPRPSRVPAWLFVALVVVVVLTVTSCGDGRRTEVASGAADPANVGWPGYNRSPDG